MATKIARMGISPAPGLPGATAADLDQFDEIADAGQIIGFGKAVIGQTDPGFLIVAAQLIGHGRYDTSRHAPMRHNRNNPGEFRIFQPLDTGPQAEYRLTAASG